MYLLTPGGDQITRAGGLENPSSWMFPTIIHSWLRKGTWETLSFKNPGNLPWVGHHPKMGDMASVYRRKSHKLLYAFFLPLLVTNLFSTSTPTCLTYPTTTPILLNLSQFPNFTVVVLPILFHIPLWAQYRPSPLTPLHPYLTPH